MSVRFGVLLALAFGVAVAYLASLNTARVRVALAADWVWDVPLAALVVGAFLSGAVLALLLGIFRDLGRFYRDYKRARGPACRVPRGCLPPRRGRSTGGPRRCGCADL